MTDLREHRSKRLHAEPGSKDQRDPFQRDRDRILYSTAFRRLAGVTQVVGVSEGHQFHNRLTHTLKVAQIARRLAEYLRSNPTTKDLAAEASLEPEIAEAAALAHDIGHPPFGHVAEEELNRLIEKEVGKESLEGFEGNAQSFRIVAKLSLRTTEYNGLNLTRGTLHSILKYPWLRQPANTHPKENRKWGAYASERPDFDFAMEVCPPGERSVEADIMDWADDIAYSVYDLEDFWKVGVIPIGRLIRDPAFLRDFLHGTYQHWKHSAPIGYSKEMAVDKMVDVAREVLERMPLTMRESYDGGMKQRADVRTITSYWIGLYIAKVVGMKIGTNGKPVLTIDDNAKAQVEFLKTLTRRFAIFNPSLAAQQVGYKVVIKDLFEALGAAALSEPLTMPKRFQDLLKDARDRAGSKAEDKMIVIRTVVDLIASLTEDEALQLRARLCGHNSGKLIDPIIR